MDPSTEVLTSQGLRAEHLRIVYQRDLRSEPVVAVEDATLEIRPGEFIAIVGPSGCGKTTFLKAVDGLLPIAGGSLSLGGKPITKPGRDRAMVFQHSALLPWRTVLSNVAFGLELQKTVTKSTALERARQLIDLVGLDGREDRYPGELSGGMQQRVNLARALATDPALLLLDEPFAALDAQMREFMQQELLNIWRISKKTALFITHDIAEAIYLADRVIVFTAAPGRIKDCIEIDLPRPRALSIKRSAEFIRYEERIWRDIEEEVSRAKRS